MIKIVTWNVNSIRARIEHFAHLLDHESPDIVLVQETKGINHDVLSSIKSRGYLASIGADNNGKAGVAIVYRENMKADIYHFSNFDCSRAVASKFAVEFNGLGFWHHIRGMAEIMLVSIYAPYGKGGDIEDKFRFFRELQNLLARLDLVSGQWILGGDFNAVWDTDETVSEDKAKKENDLPNHRTWCSVKEKMVFRALTVRGFSDARKLFGSDSLVWKDSASGNEHSTALDRFLVSPLLADRLVSLEILQQYMLMEKHSDHAPFMAVFDVEPSLI